MLEVFAEIHWIAVVAGTLVFAVLGGLYFMALMPKQYFYVIGRENLPKDQQKVSGVIFVVGPILCSSIVVIADAYLAIALRIASGTDAALLGLVIGFGFLVPMTFNIAINPLFPRPVQYGLLNAPYFLIANLITCTLMVVIPF